MTISSDKRLLIRQVTWALRQFLHDHGVATARFTHTRKGDFLVLVAHMEDGRRATSVAVDGLRYV